MKSRLSLISTEQIQKHILLIRNQRVMLDSDLAKLYGVSTKRLNEQFKRNSRRFPEDFSFRLNRDEFEALRSQFATSKLGSGGRRYLPYCFTEHGAVMLANVLNSKRAIVMSIYVVRAFIRLREFLAKHKEITLKLQELENRISVHDRSIKELFEAIRQLIAPPVVKSRKIGFRTGSDE